MDCISTFIKLLLCSLDGMICPITDSSCPVVIANTNALGVGWTADKPRRSSPPSFVLFTQRSRSQRRWETTCSATHSPHMPPGRRPSSARRAARPVTPQSSGSGAASWRRTEFIPGWNQRVCLSHAGFRWVLLQAPLCVCLCEPKQGTVTWLLHLLQNTDVDNKNPVRRGNRRLKVITLKQPQRSGGRTGTPNPLGIKTTLVSSSKFTEHLL